MPGNYPEESIQALASLIHTHLVSFYLDPETVKVGGPSGTLVKEQGSPELVSGYGA